MSAEFGKNWKKRKGGGRGGVRTSVRVPSVEVPSWAGTCQNSDQSWRLKGPLSPGPQGHIRRTQLSRSLPGDKWGNQHRVSGKFVCYRVRNCLSISLPRKGSLLEPPSYALRAPEGNSKNSFPKQPLQRLETFELPPKWRRTVWVLQSWESSSWSSLKGS